MHERMLLRLLLLVRNPPSWRKRVIIGTVLGLSLLVYGAEYFDLLPDWFSAQRQKMPSVTGQ